MNSKINKPFLHFAANCWLNGKAVVVYGDSDGVQLRAETTGGKHVPGTAIEEMPIAQYEALREVWTAGCLDRTDARIQQRALRHLKFCID